MKNNKLKIYKNKDLGIYKINNYKINDEVLLKNNDVLRIVGFREEDGVMMVDGYFNSDDCGGSEEFNNIVSLYN